MQTVDNLKTVQQNYFKLFTRLKHIVQMGLHANFVKFELKMADWRPF